jgi:uncharacterized protein
MQQTGQITDVPKRSRRRQRLWGLVAAIVLIALVDAWIVEPHWIRIRHVPVAAEPTMRLVHISDLHYKGDRQYLQRIVRLINHLEAQYVCFTGDMIEDADDLDAVLEALGQIRCPVFGVPGNHDWHSRARAARIDEVLRQGGGRWLRDEAVTVNGVTFYGTTGHSRRMPPPADTGKTVLLCHYPDIVEAVTDQRYDLILAGHSHGGQVRLPWIGAIYLPNRVGPYDRGLYQTPAGPLYVNCGLGTFRLSIRFFCRPEITVISF